MKKLSLILFSFVLMFGFSTKVSAESIDSIISGNLPPATSSGNPNRYPYLNEEWSRIFLGFRISFVTNTGVQLSTFDYADYNLRKNLNIYVTTGTKNKVTYLTKRSQPDWIKKTTTDKNKSIGYYSLSSFENKVRDKNFKFDIKLADYITNYHSMSIESFAELLFKKSDYDEAAGSKQGKTYIDDLRELLKSFGVKDAYLTEENIKTIFAVIEPTYIALIGGKDHYYGTQYEIATVAAQYPYYDKIEQTVYDENGNPKTEIVYKKNNSKKAFENLRPIVGHNGPCGAYLEANYTDKNGIVLGKELTGPNGEIAKKLGYTLSGFGTEGTYFGTIKMGKTNFNYVHGICQTETKKFTSEETVSNLGIGMGIIWIYQEYPEEDLSCKLIRDYVKDYNMYQCTDSDKIQQVVNKFNTPFNTSRYGEIDVYDYIYYCGCTTSEIGTSCSNVKNIYACSSSNTSVKYSDTPYDRFDDDEYWNDCVFNDSGYNDLLHKSPDSGKWTYYDSTLSSDYCEFYCVEELTASFSSEDVVVPSGRYFTFEQFGESVVTGSRRCQTKEVLWDAFEDDLESQNSQIKNLYVDYLKAKEYERANSAVDKSLYKNCNPKYEWVLKKTEEVDECTYSNYNGTRVECISNPKFTRIDYIYINNPYYQDDPWIKVRETKVNDCEVDETETTKTECIEHNKYTKKTYEWEFIEYQDYTYEYDINTTKLNGVTILSSSQSKTTCGRSDYYVPISSSQLKTNYDNAVKGYATIVDKMKNCYNIDPDQVYIMNGTAKVSYNQNSNLIYGYSGVELNNEDIKYENLNTDGTKFIANHTFKRLECAGNSCGYGTSYTVSQYEKIVATRSGTQKFHLDDSDVNTYKYVSKLNNLSTFDSFDLTADIYIGAHFPVAMNTKPGEYDISIEYDNLGHVSGEESAVSEILNSYLPEEYGQWVCDYEVYDKLIKDGDLKVIYRPIDLNNPFPDITAGGRVTGSNWCDGDYCGTDSRNRVVTNVITSKKDIYSKKPMYTFILTPADIMSIRSYNNGIDSLGNKRTYDDFNLKCVEGTGNGCISNFLTDVINQKYGSNDSSDGACETINRYYPTDENVFNNCRYQSR